MDKEFNKIIKKVHKMLDEIKSVLDEFEKSNPKQK